MVQQEGRLETEKFYIETEVDTSTGILEETLIGYDRNEPGGSKNAGKYLAVTITHNGKIRLTRDGDLILGRLELVEADGLATVAVRGDRMYFEGGETGVEAGASRSIVGGTVEGFVKNGTLNGNNARGIVVMANKVSGETHTTGNSLVQVVFP